MLPIIQPDWPAPTQVKAVMTTRLGGCSSVPYQSLNLATHVGDDVEHVQHNRLLLRQKLMLPSEPLWLTQVHGTRVVSAGNEVPNVEADGAYSHQVGRVVAVMTADCLPVFIADKAGSFVMVLHAGWRGVADQIIAQSLQQAKMSGHQLMAWIGPGIGADAFEIGGEVRDELLRLGSALPEHFYPLATADKWLANLSAMAVWQCQQLSFSWVGASELCTYRDATSFFSYRRDGVTGRMASLMWIER